MAYRIALAAAVLVLALPAAANAEAPCARLERASADASRAYVALTDEKAVNAMYLNFAQKEATLVTGLYKTPPEVLSRLLRNARYMEQLAAEGVEKSGRSPEDRMSSRRARIFWNRWIDVLVDVQTRQTTGVGADSEENKLTRLLKRARSPKRAAALDAEIAAADATRKRAEADWRACLREGEAGEVRSAGRLYRTTYGDVRLSFVENLVVGVYEYQAGGRIANGPMPADFQPAPGFRVRGSAIVGEGRIQATRAGNVVEGYWMQKGGGGVDACNQPREGYPYWGRIRFVFDGERWRGQRGNCAGPLEKEWNGEPQ